MNKRSKYQEVRRPLYRQMLINNTSLSFICFLSADVQSEAAEKLKHWQSLCVPAALFTYSLHLPDNLNIQPKRKKKISHSLLRALHSVARATAAILPCPICLGYTSQAGHECGMTVRERESREGETEKETETVRGERREERGKQEAGEGHWLSRLNEQDWPSWHNLA